MIRNRPLFFLDPAGCHIYVSNINSPGFIWPMLNAVVKETHQLPHKLFANAISFFNPSFFILLTYWDRYDFTIFISDASYSG
jgi:hypothetical protein